MPDNFPPMYEYLKCGRAFVLAVSGQASTYCGIGVCDPYLSQSFAALAPFRYFRSAFTWTNTAGAIAILAGQTVNSFNTGFEENHSGDGLVGPNNISDTDAQSGGVNADRGQVFFALGMTCQAEDPFQDGTVLADTSGRIIPDFLRPDVGYHSLLISEVLNYTAIQFKFGNQGCEFKIGLAKFYPDWAGPSGDRATRNGQTGAPGLFLPFAVGICTGAKDEVKQLKITLTIAVSLQVGPVLGIPTPAGATVKTPILLGLIGYVCCVGDANNCGLPSLTPEEVMVVKNTLRQNPAPSLSGITAPMAPAGYAGQFQGQPQYAPAGYPQLPYGTR